MKTIEERAEEFGKQGCGENCIRICEEWKDKNGVCSRLASRTALYKSIATEQKAIDDAELARLKKAWEKEAAVNHDAAMAYKQGHHDAIDKACDWLRVRNVMTEDSIKGFRKAMED